MTFVLTKNCHNTKTVFGSWASWFKSFLTQIYIYIYISSTQDGDRTHDLLFSPYQRNIDLEIKLYE